MPERLPPEVSLLLEPGDGATRDAAWERFVANHTRLLLHVTRSVVHEGERAMDAYAWVLERLHEDDARRLRGFDAAGPGRFTTWLVVVARRLAVDFLRHQGGRSRPVAKAGGDGAPGGAQAFRRRLLSLAGDRVDLESIGDPGPEPGANLDGAERHEALISALRELSPLDRLLLSLRFDDGLEAEQIARTLHLPTRFHVYRRLDKVLRQLRSRLNGRGIDTAS